MLELKEKCVGKETGERYIVDIKGGRNNSIEPDVKVCFFPLTFILHFPLLFLILFLDIPSPRYSQGIIGGLV